MKIAVIYNLNGSALSSMSMNSPFAGEKHIGGLNWENTRLRHLSQAKFQLARELYIPN